ncbi:MAG: WD40/YVTN/BNR-like repeat-containing protein, partial [Planctomycetota bacterium]
MKTRHTVVVVGLALLQALSAQNAPQTSAQPAAGDGTPAGNAMAAMRWRALGPAVFGGRIVDFAVNPKHRRIFYVASASGGLFKTTNNGTSFTPVFQDENTTSIGDVAIAPSNPEVLYVGTGEANNQRSSYWGDGIYKSTDAGKTWKHSGLAGSDHIGRIVVHPEDENTVYVAAAGALYSKNKERGVYRSTNGGNSWKQVKFISDAVGFIDICMDPGNPRVLYAASYERLRRAWHIEEGGPGSAIWKTTDGGDTWQQLAGGLPTGKLGRIGLCIFPKNPKILYAAIENRNDAPQRRILEPAAEAGESEEDVATKVAPKAIRGGEIYRSEDAGKTWTKVNESKVGGRPGYYYGQIRVDPQDDQRVYCLSVPVYASSDGGKTWTTTFGRGLHVDHHAMWIDPKNPNHILLGNDGGLGITYDRGKSWDHHNHLSLGQFYAVGVDMRDPYWIYGGTQDNGTWGIPSRGATSRGTSHRHAIRIAGGDGFYACIDPSDPDIAYAESQFGRISRINLRTGQRKSIRPRSPRSSSRGSSRGSRRGSSGLRSNWNSPILISPHTPRTIYFGTQFLHRSHNRGDSWTTISKDLTTNDRDKISGNVPHCTLTTIAESPKQEGLLWVGTDDGKVWVSHNGGDEWVDLSDRFPGLPKALWVSRVEASPSNAKTAYVAFTGYREDIRKPFLYVTTDSGKTFRSIANNLPDEPINVVREHPRNKSLLLVGTEFAAYASANGGGSWHRLGQGLPRVAVHDLVVHPREKDVIVGTHGRGIYVLETGILDELNDAVLAAAVHVFTPKNGRLLRRGYSRGYVGARSWSVQNPSLSPTFHYHLANDIEAVVNVRVKDATGRTLFTQRGKSEAGLHAVTWGGRSGRGRGRSQRFGNMTREQMQTMLSRQGMSAEQIKRILDQRFGQGRGQPGTGRGQPGTGRG